MVERSRLPSEFIILEEIKINDCPLFGQDLLDYVSSFRGESSGAHPASLISELYGASEHSNMLHCQQIEGWYAEYANTVRNMPYLYKKPSQVETQITFILLQWFLVMGKQSVNLVAKRFNTKDKLVT